MSLGVCLFGPGVLVIIVVVVICILKSFNVIFSC